MSAPAPTGRAARPWYVSALAAVLAVLLLLGGVWVYARVQSPYPFYGTVITPPLPATGFTGTAVSTARPQPRAYTFAPASGQGDGQTTALFFGFTHCPDVCPITLAYLEKARAALTPAQQARFRVMFVSLDPDRDSPARIQEYVRFFGQATGVRIPEPQLAQVARGYAVSYVKAPIKGGGPDDYQINHTSATFLIDGRGRRRLLWDYTQLQDVKRVVGDIQQVLGPDGAGS